MSTQRYVHCRAQHHTTCTRQPHTYGHTTCMSVQLLFLCASDPAAGHDALQVTVLEARDRLGGRVHTRVMAAPDGTTVKVTSCTAGPCMASIESHMLHPIGDLRQQPCRPCSTLPKQKAACTEKTMRALNRWGATFICGTERKPPVNPILEYAVDCLGLHTRPKMRTGPHATAIYDRCRACMRWFMGWLHMAA